MDYEVRCSLSTSVGKNKAMLNSCDPEERKKARRMRLEKRFKKQKRKSVTSKSSSGSRTSIKSLSAATRDDSDEHEDLYQKYLANSLLIINDKIQKATYDVRAVLIRNFNQENKRGIIQKEKIKSIIKDVETAAMKNEKEFEKVAMKWYTIRDINDPIFLKPSIDQQKKELELVLRKKDSTINMLKNKIQIAASEYYKKNIQQVAELDEINKSMSEHLNVIKKVFKKQYNLMENLIEVLKDTFHGLKQYSWQNNFTTMTLIAEQVFRQTQDYNFNYTEQNEANCHVFYEEYRDLRTRLSKQTDDSKENFHRIKMLALKQEMQILHNSGVLRLRHNENTILKAQYIRILLKLQVEHSNMMKQIKDYKKNFHLQKNKYMNNIQTVKNNILRLSIKSNRVADVNQNTFDKLWQLSVEKTKTLLNNIMGADRTVHEQLMCLPWISPDIKDQFFKTMMPSYNRGVEILKLINSQDITSTGFTIKSESGTFPKTDVIKKELLPAYKSILKRLLVMLSDKSGFLTESRLKMLLKQSEKDEQGIIRLETIFKCIGITKPDDMDILMRYFEPYCFCINCVYGGETSVSVAPSTPSYMSLRSSLSFLKSFKYNLQSMSTLNTAREYVKLPLQLEDAMNQIKQMDHIIDGAILDFITSEASSLDTSNILAHPIDDTEIVQSLYDMEMPTKAEKLPINPDIYRCMYNHYLVISSSYIMTALRNFVCHFKVRPQRIPTMAERMITRKLTLSRLLDNFDIERYWKNIADIYSGQKIQTFDYLLKGIQKYRKILLERKAISEEVLALRRENIELKKAIKEYKENLKPLPLEICADTKKKISIKYIFNPSRI